MVKIDVGAVRIPILLMSVGAIVLLVLVYTLVRSTWMLMAVPIATHYARSFLGYLLGVSPILAGSHPRDMPNNLALHPN